ncbi:hypothetical protein KKE60_08275, partial [Patescibacteria group bacterium]|nr:hypothetical protein [Patescibacteria group bacterium]
MTRLGKLKKYEDISPGILSQYKEPDRVVIVNNDDPDMKEIRIPLPECFDWRKIDGYGLPAKEQKWKTPVYPLKLVRLEEESENIDDLLETIELNQDYYKEEIKWIRLQWERRLKGYWLFINGKPTYLDGWHYFYCGFWNLDIGLPEYRDRDRRFFHFARYCYTTTTDNEDNDFGFRTCLGFNYPKHRRDGATHKSLCIGYEIVSRIHRANGGIQSLDDDNAQEHYTEKLIPAWQDMPFFFKPAWDGSTNPKEQLVFKSPPMRSRGGKNVIIKKRQLGGKFNYASTAKKKFYDGKKLHYIDLEEEGKTKPSQENILERWDVIRECLGQGSGSSIHGFSIHPTTVGEMREEGGENYYALCESSHWNDRNPKTGLT